MMDKLGLASVLAVTIAAPAMAQDREEAAVIAVETARLDAEVRHDTTTLAAMLADALTFVHASGEAQGKTKYLETVAADRRLAGAAISGRTVAVSGDIAVTIGEVGFKMADVAVPRRARYTAVYRRQGGTWRLLSWQNTAIR